MRVYIAGKIGTSDELARLERIDALCKSLGLQTFLPHREVGIAQGIDDVGRIFREDIKTGLSRCDFVIASLDGLHIGAGTAWELGYAYAKSIPALGLKTDEPVNDALDI